VHAARLIESGVAPVTACSVYIAEALTDDADMPSVVNELWQRCAEVAAEPGALREHVDSAAKYCRIGDDKRQFGANPVWPAREGE
jgi:hypothetical protein